MYSVCVLGRWRWAKSTLGLHRPRPAAPVTGAVPITEVRQYKLAPDTPPRFFRSGASKALIFANQKNSAPL